MPLLLQACLEVMYRKSLLHTVMVRIDPVPQFLLLKLADMFLGNFHFELIDVSLCLLTELLEVGSLATSLFSTFFLAYIDV